MRTYRNYKGVKIFRLKEMVPGSDCKFNSRDELVPATPKYDIFYTYANGHKCDTLKDIKRDIDDLIIEAETRNIPFATMVERLNDETA